MVSKNPVFAKWSGPFSWLITAICLIIAVLQFSGDSANSLLIGSLWLGVSIVFAVSAFYLGKSGSGSGSE